MELRESEGGVSVGLVVTVRFEFRELAAASPLCFRGFFNFLTTTIEWGNEA